MGHVIDFREGLRRLARNPRGRTPAEHLARQLALSLHLVHVEAAFTCRAFAESASPRPTGS